MNGVSLSLIALTFALTLTACNQTTRIFSGIDLFDDPEKMTRAQRQAICKTIDRTRFRPTRATFAKMTEAERDDLRKVLAYYRDLGCPDLEDAA